jgi:hypothetical protein
MTQDVDELEWDCKLDLGFYGVNDFWMVIKPVLFFLEKDLYLISA